MKLWIRRKPWPYYRAETFKSSLENLRCLVRPRASQTLQLLVLRDECKRLKDECVGFGHLEHIYHRCGRRRVEVKAITLPQPGGGKQAGPPPRPPGHAHALAPG